MAKLASTPKRGTTIFVESMRSASFYEGRGLGFTDIDGAEFMLSADLVAHIISITSHELSRRAEKDLSIEEILQLLCTCPPFASGDGKKG